MEPLLKVTRFIVIKNQEFQIPIQCKSIDFFNNVDQVNLKNYFGSYPEIIKGPKDDIWNLANFDLNYHDCYSIAYVYNNIHNIKNQLLQVTSFSEFGNIRNMASKLNLKELKEICFNQQKIIKKKFPILILFDINGTLAVRSKEPLPSDRSPDCKEKCWVLYLRPGALRLIEELYKNPRCIVGFFSSMINKNIIKVVNSIYLNSQDLKKINPKDYIIFDRKFCTLHPLEDDPHFSIKDLNQIINSGKFKKLHVQPSSILLIDNEKEKTENINSSPFSLNVMTYEEEAVIKNFPNNSYYCKCIFNYLTELLENEDDVDKFLKYHKFQFNQDKLYSQENPSDFNTESGNQFESKNYDEKEINNKFKDLHL